MNVVRFQNLKRPHMRHNLIGALEDFANKERQLKEWVSPTAAHRFWDSMRMPIHVIFDDLGIEDEPIEEHIGYTLYNDDEAKALYPLIKAVNQMLNEVGMEQPDATYINSPMWDEVIRTAKHAYDMLLANDPPDSFARQMDKRGWEPT